ncbi:MULTISPECIES: DUF4265 domain-containing protein [Streptomyces]|uniref:DUF4265 domain-containing protein n=1 Tax=Streptomyces TaxID=1883 RepID=UPI001FD7D0AE|nr:DUF4265 domain-containing protein [Streptomyces sp. KCTC 0041BP]
MWFRFVPRECWFPQDIEGLWATRLSAGTAMIENVPFVPSGPLARSPQAVHQRLAAFHLGGEVMSADFPMVAFNVPADADFAGMKALLNQGQDEGWWHYEVGCGTDEWWNA